MTYSLMLKPENKEFSDVILAKNIGGFSKIPQNFIRIPSTRYEKNTSLKLNFCKMPQVNKTYEVLALKNNKYWGIEVGLNEHGLGGIFEIYKSKKIKNTKKQTLKASEILRLILERSKNLEDALKNIESLIDEFSYAENPFEESIVKFILGTYENLKLLTIKDKVIEISEIQENKLSLTAHTSQKIKREITSLENDFSTKEISIVQVQELLIRQAQNFEKRYALSLKKYKLKRRWFWYQPIFHSDIAIIHLKPFYPTFWFSGISNIYLSLFKPAFVLGKSMKADYFRENNGAEMNAFGYLAEKSLNNYNKLSNTEKIAFNKELADLRISFFEKEKILNEKKISTLERDIQSELLLIKHIEFLKKWIKN